MALEAFIGELVVAFILVELAAQEVFAAVAQGELEVLQGV